MWFEAGTRWTSRNAGDVSLAIYTEVSPQTHPRRPIGVSYIPTFNPILGASNVKLAIVVDLDLLIIHHARHRVDDLIIQCHPTHCLAICMW